MQNLNLTNIFFAILILFVVIRRQLEPKTVRFKPQFFIIIVIFGITSVVDAINKQHLDITKQDAWMFGITALLGATVFASLRAMSYRFWINDDDLIMRQGNWLTIIWWVIGIGIHVMADRMWTGSQATLLLYLGLTLLIQRGIVWWRANRKYPQQISNNISAQKKDVRN